MCHIGGMLDYAKKGRNVVKLRHFRNCDYSYLAKNEGLVFIFSLGRKTRYEQNNTNKYLPEYAENTKGCTLAETGL
jgi:hypothetical protein